MVIKSLYICTLLVGKAVFKGCMLCTHVMFVTLKDVAEISPFLAIDEGKQFLVLGIESAERDAGDLDCGKMSLQIHTQYHSTLSAD